jgi:hypothetical protein
LEPKITTENLAKLIDDALIRLTAQRLGEGSTFFTEKLEKNYQQSLQGALSDVQKEEVKLNAEALTFTWYGVGAEPPDVGVGVGPKVILSELKLIQPMLDDQA